MLARALGIVTRPGLVCGSVMSLVQAFRLRKFGRYRPGYIRGRFVSYAVYVL